MNLWLLLEIADNGVQIGSQSPLATVWVNAQAG